MEAEDAVDGAETVNAEKTVDAEGWFDAEKTVAVEGTVDAAEMRKWKKRLMWKERLMRWKAIDHFSAVWCPLWYFVVRGTHPRDNLSEHSLVSDLW